MTKIASYVIERDLGTMDIGHGAGHGHGHVGNVGTIGVTYMTDAMIWKMSYHGCECLQSNFSSLT